MFRFIAYIVDAVRRPREQLTRGQHFVRFSWELIAHCYRQLVHHRAEGMAAELTYRTIFSLIPVVVLGLVMFRIVGGLDDVQQKVENQLYSFFGVPEIPSAYIVAPTNESNPISKPNDREIVNETVLLPPRNHAGGANANEDEPDDETTAADDLKNEIDPTLVSQQAQRVAQASIRRTLHGVTTKVASLDIASIGVVGLLLFVYAAVALANSAEFLCNRIYDAPSHRPIHLRLAIHWSIITLGSGLLAMSLYMSSQVIDSIGIGAESALRDILQHFVAFGASWVLLFLLYALMPNTNVSVRASAIGALVAALLWEAAKFGFQIYVTKAVPYSAIYGSIGLIPLFLFWIYVTWLIVLFGLILTHTLQTLGGRRFIRREWHDTEVTSGDPDWLLPIMAEVAHAFHLGETVDNQTLANRLGLTSWVTSEMTGKLVDSKMLLRVTAGAGQEDALTLAKPAEKTTVSEILSVAHQSRPTSSHPAWKSLSDLKKAERNAADGLTLSDLVSDSSEWPKD